MARWSSQWFLVFAAAAAPSLATAAEAPLPAPTFYKDILPLLQKHCQSCHRPGEIGPMPLLTYEGTRPWAKSIKAAVVSKMMPPWFADPQFGHFLDDRRLGATDVDKIVAWVDAGAPAGDAKDQPHPVDMSYELLAAYAPGVQPQRFDIDRSAKLVPAYSDIILQIHYTANGKTTVEDQTRLGLTLAREPPQKRFLSAVANAWHWAIP